MPRLIGDSSTWEQHRDNYAALLKSGVSEWNAWRSKRHKSQVKPFSSCLLAGAEFRELDLREAMLSFGDLAGVEFYRCDLRDANLSRSRLTDASFFESDLRGANLESTYLENTSFSWSNLARADLSNATMCQTMFARNDLSETIGLDKIKHRGPSTLGTDTLSLSQGKLPKEFLQGCGLSDFLVDQSTSLFGLTEPIQFYSCFISYNSEDEAFCKRLHARLQGEGLRVWFAPEDIKAGQKIHEQIDTAIRFHDKLLVVLSETSMKSEWVETEIHKARQREKKEGRKILFPIRLCDFEAIRKWKCFDADTGRDMAREIREYYIPGDFQNWKDHDAFEEAFAKLLKDLKAEST